MFASVIVAKLARSLILVATLAMFSLVARPAAAQAPAYRVPRTANGKPNLNGIWQAITTANWDIQGHGAKPGPNPQLGAAFFVPPGLGVVEGEQIP